MKTINEHEKNIKRVKNSQMYKGTIKVFCGGC